MKMYRFKIRNIVMNLSKPTQEAFDKFYDGMFLSVLFDEELKKLIKDDLQILINTKSYEVIETETKNKKMGD